jgi:hypothetical protein
VTNKFIVVFLAAYMVALSSPARADSADDQIDKLNALAIYGYLECFAEARAVKLWLGAIHKRIVFEPLDRCIHDNQDTVDEAILSLIPLMLEKPKALKALMDFRSMWNGKLAGIVEEDDEDRAAETIRAAVGTVRTELAHSRIQAIKVLGAIRARGNTTIGCPAISTT